MKLELKNSYSSKSIFGGSTQSLNDVLINLIFIFKWSLHDAVIKIKTSIVT